MQKKSVVIIQRRLCDYREALFEQLRLLLLQDNIEFRLLFGEPTFEELSKNDSGFINWGEKLSTRYFFKNRICWQPFFNEVLKADLVIVTQENKLVCNLRPLFFHRNYNNHHEVLIYVLVRLSFLLVLQQTIQNE